MAVRISDLPVASALSDTDVFLVETGGESKQVAGSLVTDFIPAPLEYIGVTSAAAATSADIEFTSGYNAVKIYGEGINSTTVGAYIYIYFKIGGAWVNPLNTAVQVRNNDGDSNLFIEVTGLNFDYASYRLYAYNKNYSDSAQAFSFVSTAGECTGVRVMLSSGTITGDFYAYGVKND